MKKFLYILIGILIGTGSFVYGATSVFQVFQGGTGASTLTGCLQGNGTSAITGSGSPCGSGSASSFAWPFTAFPNYVATSTTLGLLNGFFSTASSTISGPLHLPSITSGTVNVDTNGLVYGGATTTFSSGLTYSNGNVTNTGVTSIVAGTNITISGATGAVTVNCPTCNTSTPFGYPFTNPTFGAVIYSATTSTLKLDGGFLSTASSTQIGNFYLPNITSKTLNVGSDGLVYGQSTSTPTVTSPITYSGTLGQFIGGVSGTFGCASCITTSTTFPPNSIITSNASGILIATGTQLTVGNLLATTTNATSTFAGKVGIGTTSPFAELSVQGRDSTDIDTTLRPVMAIYGGYRTPNIILQAGNTPVSGTGGTINITGGTANSGGNIGGAINITSGAGTYALASGDITLKAADGATNGGLFGANGGNITLNAGVKGAGSITPGVNGYITLATNGAYVGIGTSSPSSPLTVWGGSTGNIFQAVTTASSSALSVSATGFSTTTLTGLTITGSATSTSNVGFNITTGCYAISGTCVGGGGGSGTVTSVAATVPVGFSISGSPITTSGTLGILANLSPMSIVTVNSAGTGLVATTSQLTVGSLIATSSATNIFYNPLTGFGTTTPFSQVQIATTSANTGFKPQLTLTDVNGSLNAKHWYMTSNFGNFDLGTTSDTGTYATSSAFTISPPNTTTNRNTTFGIGTTSPYATLSVSQTSGQDALVVGNAGTVLLQVTGAGAIFAPNTSSSGSAQTGYWCYDANGQLVRDTVVCIVSALKFKKDVHSLDVGLSDLLKLRPVSYFYKDPSFGANKQMGFIAEEVASSSPKLNEMLIGYDNEGAVHSFNYMQFTALLTKSIQDFYGQFQKLLARVAGLEKHQQEQDAKIKELETRLNNLENK